MKYCLFYKIYLKIKTNRKNTNMRSMRSMIEKQRKPIRKKSLITESLFFGYPIANS